jgi:hypothetical protein
MTNSQEHPNEHAEVQTKTTEAAKPWYKRASSWIIGSIAVPVVTGVLVLIIGNALSPASAGHTPPTNHTKPVYPGSSSNNDLTSLPTPSQSLTGTASPTESFSTVSLGELCNSPTTNRMDSCRDGDITSQVGSYFGNWDAVAAANTDEKTVLGFASSTCRSIKLTFGFTNQYNDAPPGYDLRISVWIVQGNRSTRHVTLKSDEIGTLNFALGSGPWAIETLANQTQAGNWGIFMNGSASCSSVNGQ